MLATTRFMFAVSRQTEGISLFSSLCFCLCYPLWILAIDLKPHFCSFVCVGVWVLLLRTTVKTPSICAYETEKNDIRQILIWHQANNKLEVNNKKKHLCAWFCDETKKAASSIHVFSKERSCHALLFEKNWYLVKAVKFDFAKALHFENGLLYGDKFKTWKHTTATREEYWKRWLLDLAEKNWWSLTKLCNSLILTTALLMQLWTKKKRLGGWQSQAAQWNCNIDAKRSCCYVDACTCLFQLNRKLQLSSNWLTFFQTSIYWCIGEAALIVTPNEKCFDNEGKPIFETVLRWIKKEQNSLILGSAYEEEIYNL